MSEEDCILDPVAEEQVMPDFSNLQTFLGYLLTTREMIHKELSNYLTNYIELNLRALYAQSCLINTREPLKIFQMSLCRLPILPNTQIDQDFIKFKQHISPELLKRIESNIKHLSELHAMIQYVKENKVFPPKTLKTQIMPVKDFLHRCYIYTGRRLWSRPEIMSHKYHKTQLDENRVILKQFINEGIEAVVNDFIKINDFYHNFAEIVKNTPIKAGIESAPSIPDPFLPKPVKRRSDSKQNSDSLNQIGGKDLKSDDNTTTTSSDSSTTSSDSSTATSNSSTTSSDSSTTTTTSSKQTSTSSIASTKQSSTSQGSGRIPSSSIESDNKVISKEAIVPVGIKNPISDGKLKTLPNEKYDFDYLIKEEVLPKKIRIALLKPTKNIKSILKITSPNRKNKKITFRIPTQLIKITNLMSKPSSSFGKSHISNQTHVKEEMKNKAKTTLTPKSPITKTPTPKATPMPTKEETGSETTISTIGVPQLNLLNNSQAISDISSNSSESFQLDTPKITNNLPSKENINKDKQVKPGNLAETVEGLALSGLSSKSNIFSMENDLPGISSDEKAAPSNLQDDVLEITINDDYFYEKAGKKNKSIGKKDLKRHYKMMPDSSPETYHQLDRGKGSISKFKDRFSDFDENMTAETNITRLNRFMNTELSPKDLLKFGKTKEIVTLTGDKINEFCTQYDKHLHRSYRH